MQGRGKGGEFLCQVRAKQTGTENSLTARVVLECALREGQQQRMVVGVRWCHSIPLGWEGLKQTADVTLAVPFRSHFT